MSDEKRTDEIQGEILHVYDGIEEADNNLPTWWLLTFFGAVAFGLVYWFHYHEYGIGKLQPRGVRGGRWRRRELNAPSSRTSHSTHWRDEKRGGSR